MSSAGVVGVGMRTPLGLNAVQTAFLLRAGFPPLTEAPLANAAGEPISMCLVPVIDGAMVGAERLCALAAPALEEAVAPVYDLPAEVYLAIDEGCPDAVLTTRLLEGVVKRRMPNATVTVEPRGEAGPGGWLEGGLLALEARRVEVVVIGGVHSDYDPHWIAALEARGQLFSRENLDSRVPGEGAAFFVLMRPSSATRLRLTVGARVLGVGSGRERARPDNDEPAVEALGLTAALKQATASLSKDRRAGWMLTDLTNEMRRVHEWETILVRSHEILGKPYWVDSPAQRMGYLGASAMPLFVGISYLGWRHGFAPSDIALALAGNDYGQRSAVCLQRA